MQSVKGSGTREKLTYPFSNIPSQSIYLETTKGETQQLLQETIMSVNIFRDLSSFFNFS